MVGNAVRKAEQELGLKREQIFISSKVWCSQFGYEKTKRAVQKSLDLLNIGYIDLMFMHFPVDWEAEEGYPHLVQDRHGTWKALEEFVESGHIRHLGISNFLQPHIEDIWSVSKVKPVVNQFELHPMYVETDTIAVCNKYGIVVQSYSPFAQWNEKLVTSPTLVKLAEKYSADVARIILLWITQKGWAVLPKSSTVSRVESNIQLVGLGPLAESDMAAIDELAKEDMPIEWKAHGRP